jgi:DNA-directed RNA polymerase specialized sigma subunit
MEFNNLTTVSKKSITLVAVIVFLVVSNIFFATQYFFRSTETVAAKKELKIQQTNKKVANFLNLFVIKVLKTDKEVSFEDRLVLENAIRDINDPDLLAKWEKFTNGTNESEIQQGVKDLLEALARKITY